MSFQQDLDVEFTIYIVQEGIAVGRSFAMYKNYNIDANKEMIAMVVGGRAFFLLAAAVVEDTQLVAPPGLAGLPPVSTGIRWCGLPSVSVRQWWR
ncbi:hypothetical protein VIGAN_08141300 [Vigna angularis var. angularis]|uniref:SLC26A/SulP transporter domain-containing protein n=1 Tax=Vigna angularis var. angularis TaxID=157739 RepID=A0A0S3SPU1_PHAAN|nr:hypothetical protein VIGAN_08141300 [Vigna angularis var. angularis]